MNHPLPLLRRRAAAALAATGLLVGGLAAVAAPAQAAQTGEPVADSGSLTWEISQLLGTARMGFPAPQGDTYAAPASYAAPLSTWGEGEGTVAADGSADLAFEGASVHWATTGNAWMQLADLEVDIDAAGVGEVTAAVTYGTTTGGSWATATTVRGPQRLPIVDLSVSPVTDNANYPASYTAAAYAFSATATDYSWSNLKGLWSPELLAYLQGSTEPAIAAYTYASTVTNSTSASGSTAGVPRFPALISMSVDRAVADTTITGMTVGNTGASIDVAGTGFKKTAPGVYASLRESAAGDPAYAGGAVQADAPTSWISNDPADIGPDPQTGADAAIAEDGSFSTSLTLTPAQIEALDESKVYTVVTRKAHGQGGIPTNADQVTETPVDVSTMLARAEDYDLTSTSVLTSPSLAGAPAVLEVEVDGGSSVPTGSVTVWKGEEELAVEQLADGTATVEVDGLPVGETPLTVAYEGDDLHWASASEVTAVVQKAPSITAIDVPAATYGTAATVVVDVSHGAGDVTLSGAGAARTAAIVDGAARFTLPAGLAPQAYTLTATYAGDADTDASSDTATLTVAKAKPGIRVTWTKKPTAKKAGKLSVVLSGPAAVAAPAGKVSAVLKSGGKSVKVAARALKSGKVVLTVPRLKAGTWKATVTYPGQGGFAKATTSATVKVKKK